MHTPVRRKRILSFSRKLFLSVVSLFLAFAVSFIAYQYRREKSYKVELLHTQLQNHNARLYELLSENTDGNGRTESEAVDGYIRKHGLKELRVTVISLQGDVAYDSFHAPNHPAENHLNRPEVRKAVKNGDGFDVRRTSETTGLPYFYSATRFPRCIVRSALPYNVSLSHTLRADSHYLWFTALITLLLMAVFYRYVRKLGTSVSRLREFAMRADRNEPISAEMQAAFPHNELGEISQHIIRIYERLHETKDALYIEREAHHPPPDLARRAGDIRQEQKEILANNLFIRYSNLISDSNLETTEEVFAIAEFEEITRFINQNRKQPTAGKGKEALGRYPEKRTDVPRRVHPLSRRELRDFHQRHHTRGGAESPETTTDAEHSA